MAPTPILREDSSLKRELLTTGELTSIVETALKFAGALAVFGYLSLRAHLNYLGIPMTRPIGTERYLMEAGYMIAYAIPHVAKWDGVVLRALVIGTGVWLLSRLLPRRLRHRGWGPGIRGRIVHFSGTRWCPFLLFTAFILFWGKAVESILRLAGKSVVGELDPVPVDTADNLFFLLLIVCYAGYAVCRWIPRTIREDKRAEADLIAHALWVMTGVGVILVALLIPITFGCCVRETLYSQVGLLVERAKDEKKVDNTCGLLVFETESNLFLWRIAGASSPGNVTGKVTGVVEVIQRAQVRQMRVGASQDLRQVIKESKKSQEHTIDDLCPKGGGQP